MGYCIVPFRAEHAAQMAGAQDIDPRSGFDVAWLDSEAPWAETEAHGCAWALVDDRGDVLGIAGLDWQCDTRAIAWAVWRRGWRRYAREVTMTVADMLDAMNTGNRIEASVMTHDFPEGHAWVERLGFRCFARDLAHYWPGDRACDLYERVR